jgi:hypothetical protein
VKRRHLIDSVQNTPAAPVGDSAALYNSVASPAALTQVFIEERADPEPLIAALSSRSYSPLEPFASLVCSAHLAFRRLVSKDAIRIRHCRVAPCSDCDEFEDS